MSNEIIPVLLGNRNKAFIDDLYTIWKSSVTATHTFLSEDEIEKIGTFVPEALKEIPVLVIKNNSDKKPIAFMGIQGQKLEMLFVDAMERGKGVGRELFEYGISEYDINELCVNEQNPKAKGFYEHMGFHVYKRSEIDEQGNPYPILYMRK